MLEPVTKNLEAVTSAAPLDRRSADASWASDPVFVTAMIDHAQMTSKVCTLRWERMITLFWSQHLSRRQVAAALHLSFEGTKSLIAVIRQAVKNYVLAASITFEDVPVTPPVPTYRSRPMAADDQPDEEYHRLIIQNRLRLFDSKISGRLIELHDKSNDLGRTTDITAAADIITQANALKYSAAKDDPFESRVLLSDIGRRERKKWKTRKPKAQPVKTPDCHVDMTIEPPKKPVYLDLEWDSPVAEDWKIGKK